MKTLLLAPIATVLLAAPSLGQFCFSAALDLEGQVTGVAAGAPAPFDVLVPGDTLSGEMLIAADLAPIPFRTHGLTYVLDYHLSDIELGGALLAFDPNSPAYALDVLGTGPGSDTMAANVLLAGGGSMNLTFADPTGLTVPTSELQDLPHAFDFLAPGGSATMELRDDQGVAFVTLDISTLRLFTCGIGGVFCTSLANSTGKVGRTVASGSPLVADNDVQLHAHDLPQDIFGYFITSRTPASSPIPVASGHLCVVGMQGRYTGQIRNSGPGGEFVIQLDLTQTPTPTGSIAVMPGDTWYFQAWHRDHVNGQPTSNFTNGIAIAFH